MMEHRLLRLTSNDYRNFRRAYSRIRYSFCENEEENKAAIDLACRFATETNTRTRGEFLNDVENPNREMYFFMVDGEIQGFFELIFKDKVCDIFEFAVFEHHKGWGSILFEEAYKIIKERECVKIELVCPFEGAQIFWQKKGFKAMYRNQQLIFRKKVRWSHSKRPCFPAKENTVFYFCELIVL